MKVNKKIIYRLDQFGFAIINSAKTIYSDMRTGKFSEYSGFANNADDLPALKENEGAKFVNGSWEIKPDFRNIKLWDKESMAEYKIEEPEVLPDWEKYTNKDPNEAMQRLNTQFIKYAGTDWVIDKKEKEKSIINQRKREIEDRLDLIDIRRLRAKEAIAEGVETEDDLKHLEKLTSERDALRKEYAELGKKTKK
ncbi:MAG: hypothetical protein FWC36_03765 [Spirochaetes bacterium]|nr:hypothetical protein [Spirochaetota bacterium]